jgi:glucan phosphorylase
MEKETKEQRFKRVAEKRVQNVLNGIRSLSQCANPRVYAWDDNQLRKIWNAIDRELSLCKESFSDPQARTFRL